ncbi:NrdG Organic radical activating enzymes [uncultured Caudovirales phage]|uniref:NrdG Organic radical activating enzymes n=1 Tax=uncultured Caudovirales phage TaxID=2100421 RepID=A0A6J5TC47_9CAUD|nr:NrdG Organic radical activating enzymes [uncultured Caudovirales phage]
MNEFKVSEVFYSAQGEGRFIGVPSVFFRTFGCNFKCAGFGLPAGEKTTEPDEIGKVVQLYKTFNDLPLANTGCDSYASWHPAFKHLSPNYSVEQSIDEMLALTPNNHWEQANGNDVHLVITGGEPLLGWQQLYPALLSNSRMSDLQNLTFETNGTQTLHEEFHDYLFQEWTRFGRDRDYLTFSVSPKLSASGEKWSDAIKPDVVVEYQGLGYTYLKFVIENIKDFDEVDQAVNEYRKAGFGGQVYVMPVGGTDKAYFSNTRHIADEALARGYRYSPRLHVDIWSNGWGK